MGIREMAYKEQSKIINESIECKKLSDVKRFLNKRLNYLENKQINNIKVEISVNFNDRRIGDFG